MGARLGGAVVSEFLAMGSHGLYVWLAYGISFAVLAGLGLRPIVERRRFLANARRADSGADSGVDSGTEKRRKP